jgi:2-haloacid dehalogenase
MTPYGPQRAVTRIARVQAVLFDTFGTVVDWRSGVTASVQQTADIHHVPLDAAAFADAWRAKCEPSMRPIRTGDRPFTRLSRLHRENLTATLAEFGLDITPNEVDRLNHAWQRLAPWADSVEGLRLLKQRYIIGPLSNGDTALLTRMAKYASLPWM